MKSTQATPLLDTLSQDHVKPFKVETSSQMHPSPTFRSVQLANYPLVIRKNGNHKNLLTMEAPLNTPIIMWKVVRRCALQQIDVPCGRAPQSGTANERQVACDRSIDWCRSQRKRIRWAELLGPGCTCRWPKSLPLVGIRFTRTW